MADNVGYTPGSGAIVAADDIGGVLHQRVKLALGADGTNDGDLSATNPMPVTGSVAVTTATPLDVTASTPLEVTASTPLDVDVTNVVEATIPNGELIEALEAMRMAVHSLTRSIGQTMPDVAGRMRIALDAISASLTLATVTTVGTVTTVTTCSTLTNQTQLGGNPAFEQIPALMRLGADSLRRNIVVT